MCFPQFLAGKTSGPWQAVPLPVSIGFNLVRPCEVFRERLVLVPTEKAGHFRLIEVGADLVHGLEFSLPWILLQYWSRVSGHAQEVA